MDEKERCPFCVLMENRMRSDIQPGFHRELTVSLNELMYRDGQKSPSSYQSYTDMHFKFCPVCGKEVIF